jgi:CHAT domain-containing protein
VDDIVNAFIDAGAQSVVSTLWPVEDQATARFMAIFYQHLAKGESKSAALRQAQMSMLRSGASPYFWAGFELDGEPSEPVLHDGRIDIAAQSVQQVGASR